MFAKGLDDLEPGFCNWLAGLADGEGSFRINKTSRGWTCRFTIILRGDDKPVLDYIREQLGRGAKLMLARKTGNRLKYKMKAHDQYDLTFPRRDNIFIIHLFERYPLRSKKRLHFEIWAEAVKEIERVGAKVLLNRGGRRMEMLHARLKRAHEWESSSTGARQLALPAEYQPKLLEVSNERKET